jgi:hypothetical protein
MSPIVRGRFVPEIENTGRVKRCFEILLWGSQWHNGNAKDLDQIEVLCDYLRSLTPRFCGIRLLVPSSHSETIQLLRALNCSFAVVEASKPDKDTSKHLPSEELATAVQTAIGSDADALVVTKNEWFPYCEDAEDLGVFLTDTGFLKRQCEIFSRGHDIPWSFSFPTMYITWTGFYQLCESETFRTGMNFLYAAQKKKADSEGQETGISLVHNRLPNICFTRDRLLFYEIQRLTSKRAGWQRQAFLFETSYFLNFYYPVIYGGFDQLACVVNQILKLGVPEKSVGITYTRFLESLKARSGTLHAIFTDAKHLEFIKRIGALRHFASHRGSIVPARILEKPDKEPTNEELDVEISEAGMDDMLAFMSEGELRDGFRDNLRYRFKVARYEKIGKIVDGVVPVVIDNQFSFIHPPADISWNFQRFLLFIDQVLVELSKHL